MKRWSKVAVTAVILFFLLPAAALAVDFEITESRINAKLDKSGSVSVTEIHTYEFDGEFNGITRMLIPKEGTLITDFSAFENGQSLRTEKDGEVYKVFRNGEDETVTVELGYVIDQAVTRYEDGAEFYWPFFDDRNETDYNKMTITVEPPGQSSSTVAIGYDEAEGSESVEPDGSVRFSLGHVDSGENGDIRTVFDAALFPSLNEATGTIRDRIEADKARLAAEQKAAEVRHRNASMTGNILVPLALLVLIGALWMEWSSSRNKAAAARSKAQSLGVRAPDEIVSMPAAMQFMAPALTTEPERLSSTLLDLIRQGQVVQVSETRFVETEKTAERHHEEIFRSILFDSFGDGSGGFDLDDLKKRTENEEQATLYNNRISEWSAAVSREIKEAGLKEARSRTSVLLTVMGFVLAGAAIYFGFGEAWIHLVITIPLSLTALIAAAFYRPLSDQGHKLREQWTTFSERLKAADIEEWQAMPHEDRLRGYTYAIGTKLKGIDLPFARFADTGQSSTQLSPVAFAYDPMLMSQSFTVASTNAAYSSGSTSVTSSGGGTGGGGGGSGAF